MIWMALAPLPAVAAPPIPTKPALSEAPAIVPGRPELQRPRAPAVFPGSLRTADGVIERRPRPSVVPAAPAVQPEPPARETTDSMAICACQDYEWRCLGDGGCAVGKPPATTNPLADRPSPQVPPIAPPRVGGATTTVAQIDDGPFELAPRGGGSSKKFERKLLERRVIKKRREGAWLIAASVPGAVVGMYAGAFASVFVGGLSHDGVAIGGTIVGALAFSGAFVGVGVRSLRQSKAAKRRLELMGSAGRRSGSLGVSGRF